MFSTIFVIYLAVCMVHVMACLYENQKLRIFTKPLLMPLLLAVYCLKAGAGFSWMVCLAVFFGFLGDTLLLVPDRKPFFLGGLAAFLVGHLFYGAALIRHSLGFPSAVTMIVLGTALVIIGIAAYFSLHRNLGEMKIPVIAYLTVILGMAFFAGCYFLGRAPSAAGVMVPIGAACFVISDYLLARSLFLKRFPQSDFWVMLTYLLAQTGLAMGLALTLAV